MKIYLLEATGMNSSRTALVTFCFCTGNGYTTRPDDTPANTFYEPRISDPGIFRQDMFREGATSGHSSAALGEIVLINTDGGLDALQSYGFDGRPCVLKYGDSAAAYASFQTVMTGTIRAIDVGWTKVTLQLTDRILELQTPVQKNKYLGTNAAPLGIEGAANLTGVYKPRLFGSCLNITPVPVNDSLLIYQANDGAVQSIPAVYDNGVALVYGQAGAYADQSAMETTAPNPGEYRVCPSLGCLRLGSTPAGLITCDAIQHSTPADAQASAMISTLVAETTIATDINHQSLPDLSTYPLGLYTGTVALNVDTALDQICGSVGGWWGFDNIGKFWAKSLFTSSVAAVSLTTLTLAELLSIDRLTPATPPNGLPVTGVIVEYAKNWTVQNSGLAGSVSDNQLTFEPDSATPLTLERRNALALEYLRFEYRDTITAQNAELHPTASEITVQTLLTADADQFAASLGTLYRWQKSIIRVTTHLDALSVGFGGCWDLESYPELPETAMKPMIVSAGGYAWFFVVSGTTAYSYKWSLTEPHTGWIANAATVVPDTRTMAPMTADATYLYLLGGKSDANVQLESVLRLPLANVTGSWDDAGITNVPSGFVVVDAGVYGGYLYALGSTGQVKRLDLAAPTGAWTACTSYTFVGSVRGCFHGTYLYACEAYRATGNNNWMRLNLTNPTGAWSAVTVFPAHITNVTLTPVGSYIYATGDERAIRYNPTTLTWDDQVVMDSTLIYDDAKGLDVAGELCLLGGGPSDLNAGYKKTNLTWINPDNPTAVSRLMDLGRYITVNTTRYGAKLRLIGVERNHATNIITLDLWG